MRKELIILIGNIGSGKSTYVKQYQEKGYVVVARDQLRYAIGGGTYIFNLDYEPTIWNTEIYIFRQFARKGVNLIIDEVGLSKEMRARYIGFAKKLGYTITTIEMPHLPMAEAVTRRMANPHGQPNWDLWAGVWTKFEGLYEEPTKDEGIDKIIKLERNHENNSRRK